MARSTTLANVLLMLKGQMGYSLVSGIATAQDQELYTLIDNQQKRLAGEYNWPFLEIRSDVAVSPGNRTKNLPTDVDFERPVKVEVNWNQIWLEVKNGIDSYEYNVFSSGDIKPVQPVDPVMRWRMASETTFEIWPIPNTAQTVRFTGCRPLASLKTAGVYDSALTCDLDDLLIVLYVAADKLARMKQGDAQPAYNRAAARMAYLRASYPTRNRVTSLTGNPNYGLRPVIPRTAITSLS